MPGIGSREWVRIEVVNELSVRFETRTFKNEIRLCGVYDIQPDIVKKK